MRGMITSMAAMAVAAILAAVGWVGVAQAQSMDGEAILNARCGGCHVQEDAGLSRISGQRKTPEGWLMTLVRMGIMHGVEISSDEQRTLVKYLADRQGLAPEEAAPYRYILERQPGTIEDFPPEFYFMCARCHSGARGALQRREKEEWRLHIHFHLGQWPTTEYQFYGRDREWFEIATTETTDWLYEHFPFETDSWTAWKDYTSPDLSGEWRVVGHNPARGTSEGTISVSAAGDDLYDFTFTTLYADGTENVGSGTSILYTGYELRGRATNSRGDVTRQVMAVSADGNEMSGRSFLAGQDETGVTLTAARIGAGARVMVVVPRFIKAGQEAELAIHGVDLSGAVDLGAGVAVIGIVSSSASTVIVKARAAEGAAVGQRSIAVGGASAAEMLTVYTQVDSVRVEPPFNIARLGGDGGSTSKISAVFEAVAYANGADGEAATDDDIMIGRMDATWVSKPFDEVAKQLDDVKFAGKFNATTGVYRPAIAGLNPARPFSTNNAGNLTVEATVDDDGTAVVGTGQLIVTVQRWNDPPIR